ncbi:MLH3 [Symbiodinium sp. CCMP2592]|nr:MLH3 [Symbiodinium sp. CCMP2592]
MYLYVNGRYIEPPPIHESIVRLCTAASLQAQEGAHWPGRLGQHRRSRRSLAALRPELSVFSNWRQPIRFIQMFLRKGTSEPPKASESTWKRTRCSDAANIVPLLAPRIAVARGPAAPCQTMSPEGTARPQIKDLIPPIAAIEAFEKEIRIFAGNNHSTLPQPSPTLRRRQSS